VWKRKSINGGTLLYEAQVLLREEDQECSLVTAVAVFSLWQLCSSYCPKFLHCADEKL
jgi:hypothetical protein